MIRLVPAALAYLIHRDRGRIKAAAAREFLRGVPRERLEADARPFAEQFSRSLLRPDAVATWKRWRGDHVRLVCRVAVQSSQNRLTRLLGIDSAFRPWMALRQGPLLRSSGQRRRGRQRPGAADRGGRRGRGRHARHRVAGRQPRRAGAAPGEAHEFRAATDGCLVIAKRMVEDPLGADLVAPFASHMINCEESDEPSD